MDPLVRITILSFSFSVVFSFSFSFSFLKSVFFLFEHCI